MKYPRYEANTEKIMEKCAAESPVFHPKASPVKDPVPIKPQFHPGSATTVLPCLNNNNNSRATHNKENSTSKDCERTLDEGFEDSGYLSLQNSQLDDHHGEEEDDHMQGRSTASAAHQERTLSHYSPSKAQRRSCGARSASLVAASTPVDRARRTAAPSFSSTPSDNRSNANLPILEFQKAVCEELEKSYRKNKRYDWSIVTKVAEDHLLDRVIGGHMGLEHVDMFTSLLSRNMRIILTNILGLLGDMDLISCRQVSRTWRKIICEDASAVRRCQRAEETLRESRSSQRRKGLFVTRDMAVSRVVLSCMQTLASSGSQSSSSSSSASTPRCKYQSQTAASQKGRTRFNDYVQAASGLKTHESLRHCRLCSSPATHHAEAQRATCTRSSCLFDFCTRCQGAFHGSAPCRTVQPRSHFNPSKETPLLPGSARSKRNIRRL